MIQIDFATAVALLCSIPLILVFALWMFYNFNSKKELDFQSSYVQQCPICTYVFFDYHKRAVKTCPRCHSLITGDSIEEKSETNDEQHHPKNQE